MMNWTISQITLVPKGKCNLTVERPGCPHCVPVTKHIITCGKHQLIHASFMAMDGAHSTICETSHQTGLIST